MFPTSQDPMVQFITAVVKNELVFYLTQDTTVATVTAEEFEDSDAVLIFSNRQGAENATKHFSDYQVIDLPLFELLFRFLPMADNQDYVVNVNWVDGRFCAEEEPLDLLDLIVETMPDELAQAYQSRASSSPELAVSDNESPD